MIGNTHDAWCNNKGEWRGDVWKWTGPFSVRTRSSVESEMLPKIVSISLKFHSRGEKKGRGGWGSDNVKSPIFIFLEWNILIFPCEMTFSFKIFLVFVTLKQIWNQNKMRHFDQTEMVMGPGGSCVENFKILGGLFQLGIKIKFRYSKSSTKWNYCSPLALYDRPFSSLCPDSPLPCSVIVHLWLCKVGTKCDHSDSISHSHCVAVMGHRKCETGNMPDSLLSQQLILMD